VTPLHAAAAGGHTPTVDALLTARAAVDAADVRGTVALQAAVHGGHAAVVRSLTAVKESRALRLTDRICETNYETYINQSEARIEAARPLRTPSDSSQCPATTAPGAQTRPATLRHDCQTLRHRHRAGLPDTAPWPDIML